MPFRHNEAQRHYWINKTRRNLIIKARQKGLSKLIDGDQLIDCLNKPTNAVVISHERDATTRLFAAVRNYISNLEVRPVVSIENKSEIIFPKRGSSYFVGTAGQKAFGRGDTVHRAHLSEAAYYPDLARTLGGIQEAAEYGQIDIETTPNGRDQVYDMVQKIKAGRSSYTFIFIPWFIDREYSVENMTAEERAGLSAAVRNMMDVPDAEFLAALTDEEKNLVERVAREWNIVLTAGQLKWRRYKIWDLGELFFQEYPEDDESCFLQTGRSVFRKVQLNTGLQIPLDDIEAWRNKNETDEEWEERLGALKKRWLYAGIDCAEGNEDGDNHSLAVIDVDEKTKRGAVIFDYTSNEPYEIFDAKVAEILRPWKVIVGVEKNGVGLAHIRRFKDLKVKHLQEWETTGAIRPTMIAELEEAYRKDDLIESYQAGAAELHDIEFSENNRAEAKKGRHDDRMMARAIAWQIRKTPRPSVTFL